MSDDRLRGLASLEEAMAAIAELDEAKRRDGRKERIVPDVPIENMASAVTDKAGTGR